MDIQKIITFKFFKFYNFKGEKVGIIGLTGNRKYSFRFTNGILKTHLWKFIVDNINLYNSSNLSQIERWQKNISHLSQNIYLIDDTIASNIAFGVPLNKIDRKRIIKAAKEAHIYNYIIKLKDGFDTKIGERLH